jgi:hypothetical protein
MAIESVRMLNEHRTSYRLRLDGALLHVRLLASRRATWLRFLIQASRSHHETGAPWSRMLNSGAMTFNPWRLGAGLIPGVPYRWKAGAVSTEHDWLRPP